MPISALLPKMLEIARKFRKTFSVKVLVALIIVSFLAVIRFIAPVQNTSKPKVDPVNIRSVEITPTTSIVISLIQSDKSLPAIIITTIPRSGSNTTYYINPYGDDNFDGLTVNTPLESLQKAIDLAQPGDLIYLFPGVYLQDIVTQQNGTSKTPITITGPKEAVITGGGSARIFEIKHSYISLKGFTIDGRYGGGTNSADFRDKLIYVLGNEPKSGVKGLKISNMTIQNSGGECIRLRYFAHNNEISDNTIRNCGIHDFRFNTGKKNGEGIYIGTAPEQRGDGKNPTTDPDSSNNNWIHHNKIDTEGNECVDIKEGSSGNIIENNSCTGQKDPESGGMDSRGSGNTFRNNYIFGNSGAGIRLGGDTFFDGISNNIYNNKIMGNAGGGIKFEGFPQSRICGNKMSKNSRGNSVGTYKGRFKPTTACGTTGV